MYLRSDQVSSGEDQQVGFGTAIVSEQAIAIGVTAIPTPITDLDSDMWFVYERLMMSMQLSATASSWAPSNVERRIDSKAMRKVEEGEGLVGVVETGVSSAGVFVTVELSFLLKLH